METVVSIFYYRSFSNVCSHRWKSSTVAYSFISM